VESNTAALTVTVQNVAPLVATPTLSALSIDENGWVILDGSFSDPGELDWHSVAIDWGDGSTPTSSVLAAGVLTFQATHQYLDDNPTGTPSDTYTISVTVGDKDLDSGSDGRTIVVNNLAPSISSVTGPSGPIALGSSIAVSASFSHVGTQDTHTCTFSWDDGTSTTVSAGSSSRSATHVYLAAGVYTVGVSVADDDNEIDASEFRFAVIYDPSAGFVTGGGWVSSPPGAYASIPDLAGRATFGFVSRYQKGATVPTGQTEFHFQVADFNFHSIVYDWLVISGARAQYKGTGSINGSGSYGFLLTATDGDVVGGGGDDRFRIKIWDAAGGVLYDNVPGDGDDIDSANPQILGGGSITIHKGSAP
jgi:hypothetical protein